MKRKLSSIEHMINGNIIYFVRVLGHFREPQLRSSIDRLQYKHPALRMLIEEAPDGLYYVQDCAPPVPIRIRPRLNESDYCRERDEELRTGFAYDQPQLRVVWLRSEREQDLLFVASHRICDGMSMVTIVREVLRSIHHDEIPVPYTSISPDDIVGDYQSPHPKRQRILAHLSNAMLALIPESRKVPGNEEVCMEWSASREMSESLRQRCRTEGASVHAALTVALDRALLSVLGERRIPAWIESPMDARRGRLSVLRSDMLFFGGGSLNLRTARNSKAAFWEQARVVHRQLREMIEQELVNIPGRYQFFGMLRPLSNAKIHTMVRIADALKINGSWNRIALSNLGEIKVCDPDAPFRVVDLRLYVHSFNIRLLGVMTYLLNGEMRFYYAGDEKCLSGREAEAIQCEMMRVLQSESQDWARPQEEVGVELRSLAG